MINENIIQSIKNILNSNINITFFKNNIQIYKQFTVKLNYYILNIDDNIFDFISKNRLYISCKLNKNYDKKLLLFFNNNYSICDFNDEFTQYKNINEFNDEFNIYNLFVDKLNLNKNNKDDNNKDEDYYIINDNNEINYKLLYLSIFSIIVISIKPLFSFCNNSYTFTKDRIKKNLKNSYNENVIIMKINLLNENFRLKYYLKEYNDISNYNEEDNYLNEYVYNNKLYKSYYSVRINDYSYDFTLNSKYDIDYKINFLTVLFNYFFYIF